MEEATKLARGDGPWEQLYDELVLTAESKEEATDMFNRWKKGMEQRRLKMNTEKLESMLTGNKAIVDVEEGWQQTVLNVIDGVTNDTRV